MYSLIDEDDGILIIKDNIKLKLDEGEVNTLLNELSLIKFNKEMNLIYTVAHSNNAFRNLARETVLLAKKDIESKQRSINTLEKFLQEESENE